MFERFRLAVAVAISSAVISDATRSQCLDWKAGFGLNGAWTFPTYYLSEISVNELVTHDDGTGPALYVAGVFTHAGSSEVSHIAKWDGTSWSALGTEWYGHVHALGVFDDGSGPALYAGGDFTVIGGVPAKGIAKWDGASWSALGGGIEHSNPQITEGVLALAVFDDGSGPALYVGGRFELAGGVPHNAIARWDGSSWSGVGGGMSGDASVGELTTFDDGSGLRLYAGGDFVQAGGTTVNSVARWDGSTWASLAGGIDGGVSAFAVFDDGAGAALHVGGRFWTAGGVSANCLARWDGSSWSALGGGINPTNGYVSALATFDDGAGAKLYAGGHFFQVSGVGTNHIACWDGASWSTLTSGTTGDVNALVPHDDGSGQALYVGGGFRQAGGVVAYQVARWNAGWSALSDGSGEGPSRIVRSLALYDDGGGEALYAGGDFDFAGSTLAAYIARWDGSTWTSLGNGVVGSVSALAVYDDGSGSALYAGGNVVQVGGVSTGRIGRWDGSSWSTLGGGVGGLGGDTRVYALAVHDDGTGPALYVGGDFTTAGGGQAFRIARWSGSWSSVGTGFDSSVRALAVYDDGTGPALYAGGHFTHAGGVAVDRVARWNGSAWSPVGTGAGGTNGTIHTLCVFESGSQPGLYAGGGFTVAGAVPAKNIARWNGSSWASVGNGLSYPCQGCVYPFVRALTVFDDGLGPALFAGGFFTESGSVTLNNLAKWDGFSWTSVGNGVSTGNQTDSGILAFQSFDDGSGGGLDLYVGGEFRRAGSTISAHIAAWRGCSAQPGLPYCFGDGSAGPCPCGNTGASGHGCQNSASTGGALLESNGAPSPDTIVLAVSDERATALTIFLQGSTQIAAVPYGDGLRCLGGALKRLYSKNAIGGAATAPQGSEPSITARSATLGDLIAPGTMRYYMTYYRDPNPAFCPAPTGSTFNSSSAVRILW